MNIEISFGGEAMAPMVSQLCEAGHEGPTAMERVVGAVPGLMNLMSGALFLVAAATPREQGCDLVKEIHGASVPVKCDKTEELVLVRLGGAASGQGAPTGQQARPALEVSYRGEILGPDETLSACQYEDVRDVLLQAFLLLFVLFQWSAHNATLELGKALFLIDGMSGRLPIGDFSEGPEEFVSKHIGACFREALYSGTQDASLNRAALDLRSRVSQVDQLVMWETDGLEWTSAGVVTEFFYSFQAISGFVATALNTRSISPNSPLCQLGRPSEEVLARELADPNSAKSIMKSMRDQAQSQAQH